MKKHIPLRSHSSITMDTLNKAQLEAIVWANDILI